MKRLFRGHRIEVEFAELGYFVQCFRLADEEKVFSYPDTSSISIYDAMNEAKTKIGKIIGNKE